MTSSKVCPKAQALRGALAHRQCQDRATEMQLEPLPTQPEMGPSRPQGNPGSPKHYSKTVRHQAGHTVQRTGATEVFRKVKTGLGFFSSEPNIPE